MADQYNTHYDGSPKWDIKNKKSLNNQNTNLQKNNIDSSKVLDGLLCSDIIITVATKSFNVVKGNKEIEVDWEKITSLDSDGNLMVINTIDNIPYALIFKDGELIKAENKLFEVMNGNSDPGCNI